MPRKTKKQERLEARQQWKDSVTETLRALGATPSEHTADGAGWASMYPFIIEETQGGPLMLSVSPALDWDQRTDAGGTVFARFLDVERACGFFKVDRIGNHAGLNPYSGKWNHHYYDWSAVQACRDIKACIEKVQL